MAELGSVNKLLEKRKETFLADTNEIIALIGDKLTQAFQKYFDATDRDIVWTGIEPLQGSDKSVFVVGHMKVQVGDSIVVGEQKIVVDETNMNLYNRFVRFAFPIIMLEIATVDELVEHVKRVSKVGGAIDVTPENLVKIIDKIAVAYQNKLLDDPTKLELLDSSTKPKDVLGFDTANLSDEHIRTLKLFEKVDLGRVN